MDLIECYTKLIKTGIDPRKAKRASKLLILLNESNTGLTLPQLDRAYRERFVVEEEGDSFVEANFQTIRFLEMANLIRVNDSGEERVYFSQYK